MSLGKGRRTSGAFGTIDHARQAGGIRRIRNTRRGFEHARWSPPQSPQRPQGYMSVARLIDSLRFAPLAQCSPFPLRFRYLRPGTGRSRSVRRPTLLCVRTLGLLLSLS